MRAARRATATTWVLSDMCIVIQCSGSGAAAAAAAGRLTGGAARSEPWTQIFADVFQMPVEIPAGTELGALGVAMTAGRPGVSP